MGSRGVRSAIFQEHISLNVVGRPRTATLVHAGIPFGFSDVFEEHRIPEQYRVDFLDDAVQSIPAFFSPVPLHFSRVMRHCPRSFVIIIFDLYYRVIGRGMARQRRDFFPSCYATARFTLSRWRTTQGIQDYFVTASLRRVFRKMQSNVAAARTLIISQNMNRRRNAEYRVCQNVIVGMVIHAGNNRSGRATFIVHVSSYVFTCLQIPDIQYGILATAHNKSTAGRYTGFQLYSKNKKERFNKSN